MFTKEELKENLLQELAELHKRSELSRSVTEDYFEPGMMENLEQYMDDFSQRMEEMLRDSDCQEERATIKRYIDKIKNIN